MPPTRRVADREGEAWRAQLHLFVRWINLVVFAFGLVLAIVSVVYPYPQEVIDAALLLGFAAWIRVAWRRAASGDVRPFVTRMALFILGIIVLNAVLQPVAVAELTVAALLPVVIVLPHLDDRSLRRLLFGTWLGCVFVAVMGELVPVTAPLPGGVTSLLRVSTMTITIGLIVMLLWQFTSRHKAATRELGSLVALSSDLAQTLDPRRIGDLMAEHMAVATGADECGICYWDRPGDRVLTYGYYPRERRAAVESSYALADYPETRRLLLEHLELAVDVADPTADPAEVGYLRSIGMSSMAMPPLIARGESIGIIEIYGRQRQPFGTDRMALARTLADESAMALDNARLYEELRHQAFHDGLTGLANRGLFGDRVEHALVRSARTTAPLAVLFLDLDDFKTVNDRFGHAAGDEVLRIVADRLTSVLRPGDTAARHGGDEFAILIEDVTGAEDAIRVARRLIDAVRIPVRLGDVDTLVGASVGIALSTEGVERADDLLRNADFAMYLAKSAGKGRFEVFRSTMRDGIAERAELEGLIQGAVERDELRLQYQPIVDLTSGVIVGVEALLRWQPTGGRLLMPGDFISLAEDTGLIVPIGRWVLDEACRQARRWQDRLGQPSFGVSVNLSARQFQHPGLVPEVLAATTAAGIDPSSLTLEITESVLMQHTASTIDTLTRLRDRGVRLSIDDFGTGYSSLSYLDRFPVHSLKIDRTFVAGFGAGHEGPVLARAIIELGQALRLEVVAEGIERADQLGPLRELGCRFGQGFLFSRPLDTAAMDDLLEGSAERRDDGIVALGTRRRSARGKLRTAGSATPLHRRARRSRREAG